MYIFKFNKIIIELINDYLSYSNLKNFKDEEIRENLFKLYESVLKINNKQDLKKEEQETFFFYLDILERTIHERGFSDYKMPNDFSKSELDNIHKDFNCFMNNKIKNNLGKDYSIIPDYIILYYIKRKYLDFFKKSKTMIKFSNF